MRDVHSAGGIFSPFVPGPLEEMKVKELKNGRLAMLAFAGFVMSAQVGLTLSTRCPKHTKHVDQGYAEGERGRNMHDHLTNAKMSPVNSNDMLLFFPAIKTCSSC